MREIKFRAWCKKKNKYIAKDLRLGEEINENEYDYCTYEQFTGLQDKNGQDIYEGDIVKHWICLGPAGQDTIISKVMIGRFGPNLQEWAFNDGLLPEIIGNIHENPELL